jgi:hypothetical protein
MLTLVWGIATEPPIETVLAELEARRAPVAFLNQHLILETELELTLEANGDVTGRLITPAGSYALEDIAAVYARPYDSRLLPSVAAAGFGSGAWQHVVALDEAMWAWTDAAPALVVNRVGPTSTNGSKPYQLECLRGLGFELPETLITTDAAEAEAFWAANGDTVYKSISGTRSIVQPLLEAHRSRLPDVATCPTQFQRRVDGTDYRVHVVGDELFTCRICSKATDYRYPGAHDVEIHPCTLPTNVAASCLRAARLLDLHVAGIDLRRTVEDAWYCFEVNPSPAFTYFEHASGLPIGAAICDLLQSRVGAGRGTLSSQRPAHTPAGDVPRT